MDFNNIMIGSDNAPRLVEYYTKLFGKPGFDEGGYTGWQIGSGYVTVAPHSEVHGSNDQPGRFMWNVTTNDVKADFERFKAAGAIVIREPYTFDESPEYWVATLADPDGNYFQLASPMEM